MLDPTSHGRGHAGTKILAQLGFGGGEAIILFDSSADGAVANKDLFVDFLGRMPCCVQIRAFCVGVRHQFGACFTVIQ